MHELSIALGIVKIAETETRKAGASAVEKIELLIGSLSGVEQDALHFVWPMAVKGSVLENAALDIETVPAKARCLECECEFDLEHIYDACPHCNSYFKNILQGKELQVKALEVV